VSNKFVDKLEEVSAIITDHFVYASGKHGSVYIRKDLLFAHPTLHYSFCVELSYLCKNLDFEVIIGPAIGGILISHLMGLIMLRSSVFAEKDGDELVFKRGYEKLIQNKKVLIVEDILNTGSSLKKLIRLVRSHNADIQGVGCFINRGNITAEFLEVPHLYSLAEITLNVYDTNTSDPCPLCAKNIPINTTFGHGQKYLESLKSKNLQF
jgi:orotate phosphoribosyltransferase